MIIVYCLFVESNFVWTEHIMLNIAMILCFTITVLYFQCSLVIWLSNYLFEWILNNKHQMWACMKLWSWWRVFSSQWSETNQHCLSVCLTTVSSTLLLDAVLSLLWHGWPHVHTWGGGFSTPLPLCSVGLLCTKQTHPATHCVGTSPTICWMSR